MISVEAAETYIAATHRDFGIAEVPLSESVGRILRMSIFADRDFPPFHRVAMDGIAIRFDAGRSLDHSFLVENTQLAGEPQKTLASESNCLEVMTGSICPVGADTVIRYEDVIFEEREGKRWAKVTVAPKKERQNVHLKGSDRLAGAKLIEAGRFIGAREIAIAATVGLPHLKVSRLPKVTILSTGDELVPVQEMPAPYQIRMSNSHMLAASLKKWGIEASIFHLIDKPETLRTRIEKVLNEADVILMSGGVSKGKTDFVPQILDELGVKKYFHRVAQRPGKPFWFGTNEADNGCAVFALPGNPISTFLCYQRYVVPWLKKCLGISDSPCMKAVLMEPVSFRPDLTYFMQVDSKVNAKGVWEAYPVQGKGSGDLANLLNSNAFLELPADKKPFEAGEIFDLWLF